MQKHGHRHNYTQSINEHFYFLLIAFVITWSQFRVFSNSNLSGAQWTHCSRAKLLGCGRAAEGNDYIQSVGLFSVLLLFCEIDVFHRFISVVSIFTWPVWLAGSFLGSKERTGHRELPFLVQSPAFQAPSAKLQAAAIYVRSSFTKCISVSLKCTKIVCSWCGCF